CATGGLYLNPQVQQRVNVLQPIKVEWDTTCFDTDKVNIILHAPNQVHRWTNVPYQAGSYEITDIKPRWWENVRDRNLQFRIVPAQGSFMDAVSLPSGPVFTGTFDLPAEGEPLPPALDLSLNGGVESDTDVSAILAAEQAKGMTPGKTAAAVLVPLIFIALLALGYFKWKRSRGKDKRKNWAEAVDKRMSTISADWKSVSVAGAQAAIRNSMAVNAGGARTSFSFGNIRPSAGFEREDEKAGMDDGAYGIGAEQRRPGVGLRNPGGVGVGGERVSRVSFAADTRVSRVSFADGSRPSGESRRTKTFRDSFVPPVPTLPVNGSIRNSNYAAGGRRGSEEDGAGAPPVGSMSPLQTQGAVTLTPEDIRARIAAGRARADSAGGRKGSFERDVTENEQGMMDDYMPALQMMRTGEASDDYLFSQHAIAPPAPTYPKHLTGDSTSALNMNSTPNPMSPVMATMAMPATVMSPDEMLRAYAERKKSMASTMTSGSGFSATGGMMSPTNTGGQGYPQPPQPVAGGRMLFGGNVGVGAGDMSPKTPSMGFAPDEYDANFSFGGQQAQMPLQQQGYSAGMMQQQQQQGAQGYGGYDAA
ncbi:hypothetical protein FA15DRAFT_574923, partial [Coprinopsis marcescibilis]